MSIRGIVHKTAYNIGIEAYKHSITRKFYDGTAKAISVAAKTIIGDYYNDGATRALLAIGSQLKAYALDKDFSHLATLKANIDKSLELLKGDAQQQFQVLLSKETTAEGIYSFFKKLSYLEYIGLGDEWPITSKGKDGNGAWGPRQSEGEVLIKNGNNRDQHLEIMNKAAEAILKGEYDNLYQGIYNCLIHVNQPSAKPSLSPGKLEKALKLLRLESFAHVELEILRLASALHDCGRILKDKIDPQSGKIIEGKMRHRETGVALGEDLLRTFNYKEEHIEIVKFLIRHHSDYWDLFCLKVYGKYNNETTPANLNQSLIGLQEKSKTVTTPQIKKMLAIIAIADVHASGDRYLSDAFIDFILNDKEVGLVQA